MKLKLKESNITMEPMKVPELLEHLYIQYDFELGTNHLLPVLYVNNYKYTGNKVYIDLRECVYSTDLQLKVELYNTNNQIVKVYETTKPFYIYSVIGEKLVRPDVESYIKSLEDRIEELENEGEVI